MRISKWQKCASDVAHFFAVILPKVLGQLFSFLHFTVHRQRQGCASSAARQRIAKAEGRRDEAVLTSLIGPFHISHKATGSKYGIGDVQMEQ